MSYVLEGDGLLVFRAYSVLQVLSEAAGQKYYTNVDAMAKELSGSPAEKAELKKLAWDAVEPGITFFLQKFNVEFYNVLWAFKAARIACPNKVQELKPSSEDVNHLRLFPLLDRDETISELQKELPACLAEANGVKVDDGSQLLWWSNKQNSLLNSSATAKLLALDTTCRHI